MISTRDLALLPDIEVLRRTLQSMAMLDAILSPEWEFRYYSFNSAWAAGEQMGSMRDGSGDDFFAHFGPAGCWIKGFAHESAMSPHAAEPPRPWPGVLDAVPAEFAGCLAEPAFSSRNATFSLWRRFGDPDWRVGPVAFPGGMPDPEGRRPSFLASTAGPSRTGRGPPTIISRRSIPAPSSTCTGSCH